MSPTSESSLANPHKQPEWRSTFRGPLALQMRTPKLRRELSAVVTVLSRFSRVRLFATVWTVARQAPLSMGFSRQERWSGLPCRPPGDLPNPGIERRSPTLQADSLVSEPPGKPFSEFTEKEKDKTKAAYSLCACWLLVGSSCSRPCRRHC